MKKIIKDLIPPLILRNLNSYRCPWKGDFSSWSEASRLCSGYSQDDILEKVSQATLRVASGEVPYERDSVLFDEVTYSWALTSALLNTYVKKGFLDVVDFGGSLGSSYFQNKRFLKDLKHVTWSVVEQENFVSEGRRKFQSDILTFHNSLAEVFANKKTDFVLLSSVLQYLENPYAILREIISFKPEVIFLDRLSVVDAGRDIITLQQVPPSIYTASYPCRFFHEENIVNILSADYELFSRFPSFVENRGTLNYKHQFADIGHYWIKK